MFTETTRNRLLFGSAFVLFSMVASAQAQSTAYTDPAMAFNKMVLDRNNSAGSYERIGGWKVQGTPMLFGDRHKGTVHAKEGTANNLLVSYNTYSQELEIFQSKDAQERLVKDSKTVDSFMMAPQGQAPLEFINIANLDAKSRTKGFLLRVSDGPRYQLYKRYFSELGIVTTNYVDATLRQYDLNYEYFYFDVAKKTLKKIRLTSYDVEKEFKGQLDASAFVGENKLSSDPEGTLKAIILTLNMK